MIGIQRLLLIVLNIGTFGFDICFGFRNLCFGFLQVLLHSRGSAEPFRIYLSKWFNLGLIVFPVT